jgi:hypothetical protein
MPKLRDGVTTALDARDESFGDYRTAADRPSEPR